MTLILPGKKILRATVAKRAFDTFSLEVICLYCKRRGVLWFSKFFKFTSHVCPNCGQRKLKSPVWLKTGKKKSFIIFK